MKKAIIVIVVVAALGAMVWASMAKNGQAGKGERVYAESVERRSISQIVKASGRVDPRVKVNVSSHVIAKIEELHVVEGQEIEKGEPFLRLEREIFEAAAERARAQLEIARNELQRCDVELADAELKLRRAQRLQSEEVLATEVVESAELAERSTRIRKRQAEESVKQAAADLKKAEDDLRKTTIYSPLTGRVISLDAEEGEVVVSGTMNNPASVIGTVADLSELLVEIDVDETDIVHVALGQDATTIVDAIPDETYTGRVVEIGSSGFSRPQQPDVTFFNVKVLIDSPDIRLRPGMSARTDIEVTTNEDTLVVPIQTVVFRPPLGADGETPTDDDDETEVKVAFVVEDGKTQQIEVELGITDTTHAEILTGLEEGQQVVTGPHRILKDLDHDQAVRIRSEGGEDDEGEDEDAD